MQHFSVRAGVVYFRSDRPGAHATLFGPRGEKLTFLGHLCRFDDLNSSYTWAFGYGGLLQDGDRFVFATADQTISASFQNEEFTLLSDSIVVSRSHDGKPLQVTMSDPSLGRPSRLRISAAEIASTKYPKPAPRRMPKVSIITCSHDRPEYLRQAIESLRAQTDPDWEHLIYDDASTNEGVFDVLQWAQEDPRVRVWRRSENLNRPAVLWNYLFDRAHGRYFTVLDDDNQKCPRFVEVMAGELDADPELGVVTCGWYVHNDRTGSGHRSECHLNLNTSHFALDRNSTCDGGSMLYRRSTFEQVGYFSEAIRTNEDWDWLRRAAHTVLCKNLMECLAVYRSHSGNRMVYCQDLGNDSDEAYVRSRSAQNETGVYVVSPIEEPARKIPLAAEFTPSQKDVAVGIEHAIQKIPWVTFATHDDLALVISPFHLAPAYVIAAIRDFRRVLFIHMEDPYAVKANLDVIAATAEFCPEVWVCTNDAVTVPAYRDVVGDRVIVCPSLGVDEVIAKRESLERDIDVLFCGYAYPSRKRFVEQLLPHLSGLRVALVGDGWEGASASMVSEPVTRSVSVLSTQPVQEAYRLHARAKAVVCLHRVHGDCSDGPFQPLTVNRGHMEGYFGPRVFLDRARSAHAFDPGDVVWYDHPVELAQKLVDYLAKDRAIESVSRTDTPEASRFAEKCALLYTYRARVARILNCVRSPRYLAEIP